MKVVCILTFLFYPLLTFANPSPAPCTAGEDGLYMVFFNGLGGGLIENQVIDEAERTGGGVYSYRKGGKAFKDVLDFIDTDNDGDFDQDDEGKNVVFIMGYSWGATTGLDLGHRLSTSSKIKNDNCIAVTTFTFDPVVALRNATARGYKRAKKKHKRITGGPGRSTWSKPDLSIYSINLYQKIGFNATNLANQKWYVKRVAWALKGSSVSGAEFDRNANAGGGDTYDHFGILGYAENDLMQHAENMGDAIENFYD